MPVYVANTNGYKKLIKQKCITAFHRVVYVEINPPNNYVPW